jgi:hypothetical protein
MGKLGPSGAYHAGLSRVQIFDRTVAKGKCGDRLGFDSKRRIDLRFHGGASATLHHSAEELWQQSIVRSMRVIALTSKTRGWILCPMPSDAERNSSANCRNRNQMELNLLDSRLGLPKDISPQKQFTVLLAGAERQSSQLLRVGHFFDVLLFAALRALLASEIRFRASGMWVLALAGAVFYCGRFIRSNVGLSETIG